MPLGQVTFEPKEVYEELCKGLWGKQSRRHRCRGPGAGLTVAVEWCRSTEEESVLEQCARGCGHGRCLELTSLRLSSSSPHITTADKEESPAHGFLTILRFFQYHFLESTVLKLMLIFYLFPPPPQLDIWSKSNYQVFQKVSFPFCFFLKRLLGKCDDFEVEILVLNQRPFKKWKSQTRRSLLSVGSHLCDILEKTRHQ